MSVERVGNMLECRTPRCTSMAVRMFQSDRPRAFLYLRSFDVFSLSTSDYRTRRSLKDLVACS